VTRTLLITALLLAYAAMMLGVPARGTGSKLDPLDPRPHRVESLIVAQRFADALPLGLELRRNFPDAPEAAYWLGTIQHGLGRFAAAAEAWEEYARLTPEPADACPAWPEAYARSGRLDRALTIYERCATLDSRDPARFCDLADAYERAGRRDAALDAYRRAAALDPDNPALQERIAGMSRAVR
jgi:tetratricopeptide (TPR) repeat protein